MKNIVVLALIFISSILQGQAFTEIDAGLTGVYVSSVAWGDYDNDGDLDILIAGNTSSGAISKIYNNDSGVYTDINAGLIGVGWCSVAWGDYDNDNDLDVLLVGLIGYDYDDNPIYGSKTYRNDSGVFTDLNAGLLEGLSNSSDFVAWGDYDNDGDLDILIKSKIYCNNSGIFTDISADLDEISNCSVAWGDYDNDGDLDILIAGYISSGAISKIYNNDSGVFNDINAGLTGVSSSSVAWGDYGNDGDLDILLAGFSSSGKVSKIYLNDAGIFSDINADLVGVSDCSVAWGDYDNDGDLDILMTGNNSTGNSISKIYRNDSGIFSDISAGLTGVSSSSAAWGDYDNDGDLDILITGYTDIVSVSQIYRNNTNEKNTPPNPPSNLSTTTTDSTVTFHWDKATDNETPQDGLSYNLYIRTDSLGCNIKSPMSNIENGYRNFVEFGNAEQNTSWSIKDLPDGTYYWSVQAIDQSFSGSEFAPEQSIIVTGIEYHTLPSTTELFQNYPNPFNPVTEIKFLMDQTQNVNLSIFNSKCELIKTLFEGKKNKGMHTIDFNASQFNSGIYFYKLTTDKKTETRKMLLLK